MVWVNKQTDRRLEFEKYLAMVIIATHKKIIGVPMVIQNVLHAVHIRPPSRMIINSAKNCGYLSIADHDRLTEKCRSAGKMFGSMLKNPEALNSDL